MYHLLDAQERANRAALLLVRERYASQLSPWVKSSVTRLQYARPHLNKLIAEASEETGADLDYVASRFDAYLADTVLETDKNVKREDVKTKEDWVKFVTGEEDWEDVEKTDVLDRGDVPGAGLAEALEPDARIDLNADTQKATRVRAYVGTEAGDMRNQESWKSCFRCGEKLNPVYAQTSPVCMICTNELKTAGPYGMDGTDPTNPASPDALTTPVNPNQQFQCKLCQQNGQQFQGTKDEVLKHIQDMHGAELQQQQQSQPMAKQAQDDPSPPPEKDKEILVDSPNSSSPKDRFVATVQQMADRAAAKDFSQPSDDDVRSIADQYSLDPESIRNNLVITAIFGDWTGVNGELTEQGDMPIGYEEVQNIGGRVDSHEALIPVEVAIAKVADETNTQRDLVESELRDSYGADLSDKFHASVSGEQHFYLPQTLIGDQGPTARPDVAAEEAQPQPQ